MRIVRKKTYERIKWLEDTNRKLREEKQEYIKQLEERGEQLNTCIIQNMLLNKKIEKLEKKGIKEMKDIERENVYLTRKVRKLEKEMEYWLNRYNYMIDRNNELQDKLNKIKKFTNDPYEPTIHAVIKLDLIQKIIEGDLHEQ